jgi:1-acyl-sn-glycerol-3-phosphate acyltransferase
MFYCLALVQVRWAATGVRLTGAKLAHARALWFHRWSKRACRVLGLRVQRSGFAPVSGIIVANHLSLLDALLLGAIRPMVLVAGSRVRDLPFAGRIARNAGAIFVEQDSPSDLVRVNFMIQRAVQRRLVVVLFPECTNQAGSGLGDFSSGLLQSAADSECSLSGARIVYRDERGEACSRSFLAHDPSVFAQLADVAGRRVTTGAVAFTPPAYRPHDRKQLARRLHAEVLALGGEEPIPAR